MPPVPSIPGPGAPGFQSLNEFVIYQTRDEEFAQSKPAKLSFLPLDWQILTDRALPLYCCSSASGG
ncbi:MAG: hypothetical protein WBF93_00940, partial [Pirellulales bacterium]